MKQAKKLFDIFNKLDKRVFLVILILIPMFLAFFFRAYPAYLPVTDQWAENTVENNLKNQLASQLNSRYPNLPPQNRQALLDQEYENYYYANKDHIDSQVKSTSDYFKSQLQNDAGETYFLAIDPYIYLMDAESLSELGHVGDEIVDGQSFESRQNAPLGSVRTSNPHSNLMVILSKFINIFKPVSLMGGSFWLPAILAALATIPAFLITRRKAGVLGGFVAATIVGVHGAFLGRTPAGFVDTDVYNVFFPLLIAWLLLESFESKDFKWKLGLGMLSGISTVIYSFFWTGWAYIFYVIIGVFVAYVGYEISSSILLKQKFKMRSLTPTGLVAGSYFSTSILLLIFTGGLNVILAVPKAILGFANLKVATTASLWPNVLTTVAELNEVNFAGVMGQMGGRLLFVLAILGMIFTLIPKDKLKKKELYLICAGLFVALVLTSGWGLFFNPLIYILVLCASICVGVILTIVQKRKIDVGYAALLLAWFVMTLYATTKGVRFTLLLVPIFSIAVGTAIGMIFEISKKYSKSKAVSALVAIVLLMILVTPIQAAHQTAMNEIPSMNDAWWTSLTKIKTDTSENTIITSWWDFGHWFKYVANRGVTFDGGSQGNPAAHWVGNLLLSPDEDKSVAIQRMLNCGLHTGYDVLLEYFGDTLENRVKVKKLLNSILDVDEISASSILKSNGLSQEQIDSVLALTHCEARPSIFITSEDMVGKAGVWGHFGSWSFERAYVAQISSQEEPSIAIEKIASTLDINQSQAAKLNSEVNSLTSQPAINSWVSPWPSYFGGWKGCEVQNGTLFDCPVNVGLGNQGGATIVLSRVVIDSQNPESSYSILQLNSNGRISGQQEQQITTLSIAGETIEIILNGEEGYGVLLDLENERVLVSHPLHTNSLFTQLFFLDGKYNDNYEKFSDVTSFNGQRIVLWRTLY